MTRTRDAMTRTRDAMTRTRDATAAGGPSPGGQAEVAATSHRGRPGRVQTETPPFKPKFTVRRWWRRFWERAPRQLHVAKEGRILIGIAFAVGLAALNTGNNLLYLGWGMVLSAIVLSGVLSEATLRALSANVVAPGECRAQQGCLLTVRLSNHAARIPAYALQASIVVDGVVDGVIDGVVDGVVDDAGARRRIEMPFVMRLPPRHERELAARFTPTRRGHHSVGLVVVSTAYPFGFFEKSRRLRSEPGASIWCFPPRVAVDALLAAVTASLGEAPSNRAGRGDDFFSLRPYRHGDDLRRVSWKRSARTGRWVSIETEATAGRELTLEIFLRPLAAGAAAISDDHNEYTLAVAGSLSEDLLHRGYRVGLRTHGALLPPEAAAAGRRAILGALARVHPRDAMPPEEAGWRVGRVARVGLVAVGARVGLGLDATFTLDAGHRSATTATATATATVAPDPDAASPAMASAPHAAAPTGAGADARADDAAGTSNPRPGRRPSA